MPHASGSNEHYTQQRPTKSALPQPPVCCPTALVFEVHGTTAEGDSTSAQIVLWDLPGTVPIPQPPRTSYVPASAEERSAIARSVKAATAEVRSMS